uniref:Inter-alpha-trypsin inhibitor heavy chain C-terminal domain-containing protein n=1 Tax=Knipowitschia caucasica TaxID=637954 RepID=A0AAV2M616_KNICA
MTQNHFRHLFDGSEIVVAGKLSDNNINNLLVEVSAQGSSDDFQVQGQAKAEDWGVIYPDEEYIFGNFTERLWAYLTIQQLLDKSDIGTVLEKEESKDRALHMSLEYGFVTPHTSMVVAKPQTEDTLVADKLTETQRQQAERAQGSTAASGVRGGGGGRGGGRGGGGGGGGGADGDPHFMIELPERDDALCFNINHKPGTIFNLVRDPKPGFIVNGEIIGKHIAGDTGNMKTYFGRFGITHDALGVRLEVSTRSIIVTQDGEQTILLWSDSTSVQWPNVKIKLTKNCSLTVTMRHSVKFMVIKHTKLWKRRHDQQSYLGFYNLETQHLSPSVYGLLGQFYHGVNFELTDRDHGASTMFVKGRALYVTRHWQKDFSRDVTAGQSIGCWFVGNNGTGLIDGVASDYIVPTLFENFWDPKEELKNLQS